MKTENKTIINSLMHDGHMDIKTLAGRLHVNNSTAGCILKKLLLEIVQTMGGFESYLKKKNDHLH